jgi:hypothetical protein
MIVLLVLMTAATAAAPTAPAPRSAISQAQAASFEQKVEALCAPRPKGKKSASTVLITEGELNSYVNLSVLRSQPVRDVELRLEAGRARVSGLVDIDRIKDLVTLSPWNPISFLSGFVAVTAAGRYEDAGEGLGRVVLETVEAETVPIPITLIEQMVAASTISSQSPRGFDMRAPFRLPPGVRRMRLAPGRVLLDQ